MRSVLWLSIFVFISTLFWPQLLDLHLVLLAVAISLLLLVSKQRLLAVIPITAVYFSCYASLTLTGQLFPSVQLDNKHGLEMLVDDKYHTIDVQVVSLISKNNRGYFNAKLLKADSFSLNYTPLIELRWYKPTLNLQAGQIHRFKVRFKPIYGRANPAGFDRQKWAYSEHLGYRASVKTHIKAINTQTTLRARFYNEVQQATIGLLHQGLILALSFADKSLVPYEIKDHIRNIGVSHLFAISGLHIGLLFSVSYLLFALIFNRVLSVTKMGWFSFRLINFSALIGAWGYAYLAGFSVPTQRAFLMLLTAVFILSMKRNASKTDILLLVLFTVLIWDPLSVLSLSLWLSFSAVAIILVVLWSFPKKQLELFDKEEQHCVEKGKTKFLKTKVFHYFSLLLGLQIGLTLLMLPVQLISFSGLSLVSLIVNFFAVPLFSLVIIPAVLSAAFITPFVPVLATYLFFVCDLLIAGFFYFTQFLNLGYQWFSSAEQHLLLVLFALLLLLFWAFFQGAKQRNLSYLFSLLLIIVLFLPSTEVDDSWLVEVVDVGQGLSVIVRSGDEVLVYDTGARYPSGFNMVDAELAPYLISQGIKQIDHLVISHSDIDHAGGIAPIEQQFILSQRWAGEAWQHKNGFRQCKKGQSWKLGKLNVEVLSPDKLSSNNNNNSCVIRITDGTRSLLLTGDIEKRQEKILIQTVADKLPSDILLAPHHGSRHSSSDAFIAAVNPKWVVFSAGYMNHWGFPADEVIKRYQKQSVERVNSGVSGLIRFQISAQTIKMQTFREDLAPYWYHHSLISSLSIGHIDDK